MKIATFISTISIAFLAYGPAAAETLKKVPATFNPNKAYILLEYRLMQNPMANLPGSRKTLPLTTGLIFARYDPVLADIRGLGKAKANPVPPPEQPIEPFRNREVIRGDAARLFLIEVEPDTWVIQGWGDTSFSLGSYAFKLEPGSITDLGVATAEPDWAEGDKAASLGDVFGAALVGPFGKRPAIAPMRVSFRARNSGDMPIPAGIAPDHVRHVTFVPNAKFGNHLGGLVNRIEGVNSRLKAEAALSPAASENTVR